MGLRGLSVKTGSTELGAVGATPVADDDGLSVAVGAVSGAVLKPKGEDVGAEVEGVPGTVAQAVSSKLRHKNAAVVQRCATRESAWPRWLVREVSAFIKIRFSSCEARQKSRHRLWPARRVDAQRLPQPVGGSAKKG